MNDLKVLDIVNSIRMDSRIFDDIADWFDLYAGKGWQVVETIKQREKADIYLFNRPNFEKKLPRNSVAVVHHDFEDKITWLDFSRFERAYRQAGAIVCLNSLQKKYLEERGFDNCIVIPHGCAPEFKGNAFTTNRNSKLSVGFISKRYERLVKGEPYLYQLMEVLEPSHIEFVFVGQGRFREASYAAQQGFSVRCWENLPYRLFPELYGLLDVLLITSKAEGGPASLPEAVATQTPVVGFEVGMVSDWIKHQETGLILSGDTKKDAAALMELAANKKEQLLEMQKNMQNVSSLIPEWKDVVGQYFRLFEHLMTGEGRVSDLPQSSLEI